MRDSDCTKFLEWALPKLDLRWRGFEKVRGQVCKRLRRRLDELGISDFAAYRRHLECDPEEWRRLDACCHITISRFYRDAGVFDALLELVLPDIAGRARREERDAQAWSIGCASGEEPYTLKIIWDLLVAPRFPGVALAVTATDIDGPVLKRANRGCYRRGSLRELPPPLRDQAFDTVDGECCVRPLHRKGVTFLCQDLRRDMPEGLFDIALCRNLVFTYFAPRLQQAMLARIGERLAPRGYLVIGSKERLPPGALGFVPVQGLPTILQRTDQPSSLGADGLATERPQAIS
jgi:chemotaxis protein methyltransferase CheR